MEEVDEKNIKNIKNIENIKETKNQENQEIEKSEKSEKSKIKGKAQSKLFYWLLIIIGLGFLWFVIFNTFSASSAFEQNKAVVMIDTQKIIQRYAKTLATTSNLSDSERVNKARLFSQQLMRASDRYAQVNNVVILQKGAVISGANDVSDEVIALIGDV
ncbi:MULTISPECIES: TrbI F-type domain-containing protein [Cysteiniphilum]|uniref:TrbI F-type domain-containing protein n=1 Tax=Cysteiniphilum TaxID=2056696 RepID=UPI00177E6729|nr:MULTISPECIES: TrbI F-type domain-containing protein [Cysteiniphilum]